MQQIGGRRGTVDLGKWSGYGEPAISVVTQSKLMVGVHRANPPQRKEKRGRFVQAVITNVSILPIDSQIADVHTQIASILSESGLTIGPHDNWIAATAITYDYDLLATNANEFRRVPNLRVIDYLDTT
ncbi:MAG: PIN domain-containing protein [Pirellulaceae bacterium]|nr:PIN domain-containing protein [Planctomycetales bacterium]